MNDLMKTVYTFLFGLGLAQSVTKKIDKIFVDPKNGHFIDESGRVRMFRGINVVKKNDPWYQPWILEEDKQDLLVRMGFNSVRLGIMWSGVQPQGPDSFDYTYISIMKEIVESLGKKGMHSLLDAHQDGLWSGYYGVPKWIKDLTPPPKRPYPWPFNKVTGEKWFCAYFTEEISAGFQHLYDNTNDIADHFVNFWRIVADNFKKGPEVLGYDILNEPWAGNPYEDTSYMLPGVAGHRNIAPLFEKIAKKIWEVTNEAVVFWEGTTWATSVPWNLNEPAEKFIKSLLEKLSFEDISMLIKPFCDSSVVKKDIFPKIIKKILESSDTTAMTNTSIFGLGYDNVPGGDDYKNRTVLSWHHYCPIAKGGVQMDFLQEIICHNIIGRSAFHSVNLRTKEMNGAGSMLTEFGLCRPDVTKPKLSDTAECNFVMSQAEENFQSWMFWDTATSLNMFIDDNGNMKNDTIKMFARPYPQATNGVPHRLSFDPFLGQFHYYFIINKEKPDLPTEIVVPEFHYPNFNYVISISPHLRHEIHEDDRGRVLLYYDPNTGEDSTSNLSHISISRP